ncbi:MAG: HAD hydrolase-like protein [Lachnospiraceae bacterium]|nr:HAD hydrolase-like protein [Lachnospiraceae bacterium]
MWNTVLFDLDGTLTDSAPGITRCVQYALEKEFGIIRKPEELIEFVGPPLREQFMIYTGCDEAAGQRAVERYRERYRSVGIFENSLYEGIPELLGQLKDEGFTIALSSSKPVEFCRQVLEAFGIAQYFDVICGSDMAGRHTGKAEIAEDVVRRLGMDGRRNEVVLVGDRKYDIQGARQCGIGSIGVSYGYGSREELEDVWPDCIVDSVTELRNVLIGQVRAEREAIRSPKSPAGKALRRAADGNPAFMIWRLLYPVLLHYGLTNVIAISAYMLILFYLLATGGRTADVANVYAAQAVLITGIADAAVIPAAWFFFRADELRRKANAFAERILNRNVLGVTEALRIIGLVIGFSCILNILISYIPIQDETYQGLAEQMFTKTPFIIQIIVIGILAPFAEELIFRALIFRRMRDYAGFVFAAVSSGLFFGIYHGNITQGIFAFIMGMLFAAVYEHYGTLWASIIAHISNNLFATIENYLFSKIDVPDVPYMIFLGIAFAVSVLCFVRILTREDRVNVV